MRTRAERRHNNVTKALRKQSISKHNYGFDWYDNLHQYSKNKVHCSCGMCRFRNVYEPDAQPIQDLRRIEAMNYQIKEIK